MLKSDWSATDFFQNLVAKNKLANTNQFVFCKVSGLEGFEEALHAMQSAKAFCCVSDIADGYTELNNTPRTRRIKTVFLAMRHAIDDTDADTVSLSVPSLRHTQRNNIKPTTGYISDLGDALIKSGSGS